MAVPHHLRHAKFGGQPEARQVKIGADPESTEKQTIAWHFHRLDQEHTLWGWQLPATIWRNILTSLKSLEGLTWAEIKQASGGRRIGTNHHSLKIAELNKAARDRITELRLDEYDTIFSLRISNTVRMYGIRDGRVMRLLWYDRHHGTRNEVYPTR